MDFINDVTLKDSKLIFSGNNINDNIVKKDVITMENGHTIIESDIINSTSEIRVSSDFGNAGEVLLTPYSFNFNNIFRLADNDGDSSGTAYKLLIDKICPVIVDSCAIFNNKLESTSEFKAADIDAGSIKTIELTTNQLKAGSAVMTEFEVSSINMLLGGSILNTEFEGKSGIFTTPLLIIDGGECGNGVIITNNIDTMICNGGCNGGCCAAPYFFIGSEIKLVASPNSNIYIDNNSTKIYSHTDIKGKLRVHSEFSTNNDVTFEDTNRLCAAFTSKIPSIFENNVEFKKPVVSIDSISASEFKTHGVVIHEHSIDVTDSIKVGTEFNLPGAFNVKYNSGTKTGSVTIDSASPLTVNSKAIFNNGICTKSITSITGTQIFDTTDGKGFNFKGLYTLNGFGTTNKPFFKQESATNNWIDVTTLKEGGTSLVDKYALKTDIPAEVDVSNKADKATTLAGYGITDAYTKSEIDSKNVSFLTKESSGIQTVSSDLALTGYVLIDNLSIDELEIESLTASSKVTLSGGLEVSNGLVADSIKVGSDTVALAKNIPNVSSFITKDVSNLTNYETKTTAEGKYALKTSLSSYALKSDISNVYKYIGSVNTAAELPSNLTAADSGKVYNIVNASTSGDLKVSAGDNVAWTGSSWDKLGGSIDLSNYAQKATTLAGYGITDAYTKTEVDANNSAFLTKESSGIQTVSSDLALTGYVLIDNLAIDELNIESLTATSKVTLSGGLEVSNGLVADSIKIGNDTVALAKNIPNVSSFITKDVSNLTNYETKTVAEGKYALKTDIPDISDVKTPIFKYFQNPVIPASCSLFAIATNAEFENMPMMQLVRNSDNKIVSADISWKSNSSGGHDIMVGIDHSSEISANTYTLHAFGY